MAPTEHMWCFMQLIYFSILDKLFIKALFSLLLSLSLFYFTFLLFFSLLTINRSRMRSKTSRQRL